MSSFSEVLYRRDVLKNFLKFTDKLKKQPSVSVLSKDVLKHAHPYADDLGDLVYIFNGNPFDSKNKFL